MSGIVNALFSVTPARSEPRAIVPEPPLAEIEQLLKQEEVRSALTVKGSGHYEPGSNPGLEGALTSALAKAFPDVAKGDLSVSIEPVSIRITGNPYSGSVHLRANDKDVAFVRFDQKGKILDSGEN